MKRVSTQVRAGLLSFALLAVAAPTAHAGLVWSPSPHNYGSVTPGTPVPQVFTLTATCDGSSFPPICTSPLHVYGATSVTGAGFALGANSCTGPALATILFTDMPSCTSTVTFTPPALGSFTGSLDTSLGPVVALSGTGAFPAAPTAPTAQTPAAGGVAGQATRKCKKKKRAAAAKKCKRKK